MKTSIYFHYLTIWGQIKDMKSFKQYFNWFWKCVRKSLSTNLFKVKYKGKRDVSPIIKASTFQYNECSVGGIVQNYLYDLWNSILVWKLNCKMG